MSRPRERDRQRPRSVGRDGLFCFPSQHRRPVQADDRVPARDALGRGLAAGFHRRHRAVRSEVEAELPALDHRAEPVVAAGRQTSHGQDDGARRMRFDGIGQRFFTDGRGNAGDLLDHVARPRALGVGFGAGLHRFDRAVLVEVQPEPRAVHDQLVRLALERGASDQRRAA